MLSNFAGMANFIELGISKLFIPQGLGGAVGINQPWRHSARSTRLLKERHFSSMLSDLAWRSAIVTMVSHEHKAKNVDG